METGVEAGSGGVCNAFLLPHGTALFPRALGVCALDATAEAMHTAGHSPQVVAASQGNSGGPADLRENIHGSVTIGPDNRISLPPNHHPFMDIRVRKTSVWPLAP